uniref:SAM domain-containing protein n=1 Tax=Romanomermis culicivorax TaxID=13658 RepID=A0A915ITA3_ROMCU
FNSSPLLNERASNDDQKSGDLTDNKSILENGKNNRQFQSDLDLNQQDPLILINKRLSQITTNFSIISGINNLHLNNSCEKLKIEENQMQNVWQQIAAEPYSSVFDDQEMDLDTFLTLNDGDLREMGLQDPGQRHEILKLVSQAKSMLKNRKMDEISSFSKN